MLLPAFILHAQFVIRRRADHITGVIFIRYVVGVAGVMECMSNVRTVWVTLMKCDSDFSPLN